MYKIFFTMRFSFVLIFVLIICNTSHFSSQCEITRISANNFSTIALFAVLSFVDRVIPNGSNFNNTAQKFFVFINE